MKRAIAWSLIVVSIAAAGCRGGEHASGVATETIAPAQPKPAATDSDAMTQTVDIESGRSDAEGGGLTTVTTATTATTGTTATAPPPPTTTTR